MAEEKRKGTVVPFELHAGSPIRLMFSGVDGKPMEGQLQALVYEVIDYGPEVPPETRYGVNAEWKLRVKDRQ